MHAQSHTHTNRHTARTPSPHLIYSHFESPLSHSLQREGQRAMITEEARRCMREGDGDTGMCVWGGGGWMTDCAKDRPLLFSPIRSANPTSGGADHRSHLPSPLHLVRGHMGGKWLPAVLPLQGLFPHINTFSAQLHLLHTLKTHTQGEPRAVNDGHMQNWAHL